MRFCEKDADFPVFEVTSTVEYQTPRRAMVMERMLLRLVAELDAKAAERGVPLAALFAERLCVPHALAMMDQCFADMRQQGLLVMEPGLQGFGAATLADLQVDPQRGKQLLETGKLPGRITATTVGHLYDPIRQKLCESQTREARDVVTHHVPGLFDFPGMAVEPSKLAASFADTKHFSGLELSGEVRSALDNEKHDWLKPDTEVESVVSRPMHTGWKTRKVQVDIDLGGRVSVSVPACKATEKWLRALPAEQLWQEFLAPMFGLQRRPGLPVASLTAQCIVLPQGTPSIADTVAEKAVIQVRQSPGLPAQLNAPAGHLQVWVVAEQVASQVAWSQDQRGAVVILGNVEFGADFVALVRKSSGEVLLQTDGILELQIQDLSRLAEAKVVENGPTARQTWNDLVEPITAIATESRDPQDLAVLAAWMPADQVLQAWEAKVTSLTVRALSDAAVQLRLRMEGLAGQKVPTAVWEEAMLRCAQHALQREASGLSPQQVVTIVEALQRFGPRLAAALEGEILAKVRPLATADELRLLRNALPTGRLPQSEVYFSGAVVEELMQEAFAEKSLLSESSPLELAASTARRAADLVAKEAGVSLGRLTDDDAMAKTLAYLQPTVLDRLQKWSEAVAQLKKVLAGHLASGSRLDVIDRQLTSYRSYLDRLAKGDARMIPTVLDTNVFLDFPQVLDHLGSRHVAVVPQQVLAELDRKKGDPVLAKAAAKANAALDRHSHRVEFEEGNLLLLPAAYRSSADDQILSVAMRWKWRKVVLVTSDKNLRNKAKSLGIHASAPTELWPALKSEAVQGGNAQ